MLSDLYCEKFRISKPIEFNPGLNVCVGDEAATNSIGKSTFLMVIDFVLGGDTLLSHNADIVNELGHHDYFFSFIFAGTKHSFRRSTGEPKHVFTCKPNTYEIDEVMSIENYREYLREAYALDGLGLTFRKVVSLFSRIWGKENLNPKRPLDSVSGSNATDALHLLLKLYKRYEAIADLIQSLSVRKADKKSLADAMKRDFVPNITKKQYRDNQAKVEQATDELEDITNELKKYATSLREIANREVQDIKHERDSVLRAKSVIESRLTRVENSLRDNRYVKSKDFEALKDFFADVNDERIAEVEGFHSAIVRILRKELRASQKQLSKEQGQLQELLDDLDKRLSLLLQNVDNPTVVVDRVYALADSKRTSESENEYYDKKKELANDVKEAETELEDEKAKLLAMTATTINDQLQTYSESVFGKDRKSPYLTPSTTNYKFEIYEDTGTGRAYSDLILFDWSVATTSSSVPILIHDSLLFKNVENDSVARMMPIYAALSQQTFIAIDEVSKYGDEAVAIIRDHTVLSLSDDEVLYVKDWRSK